MKPLPQVPSIIESVKQEASNIIWLVMALTALLSGLCGVWVNGLSACEEAVSIVVILAVILIVMSAADWCKDKRFVALQSMVQDE